MRNLVRTAIVLVWLSTPATALAWGVKVSPALLLDPTRWGGHASVELPLSDEYPTFVSAFVEHYRRSESLTDTLVGPYTARSRETPIGLALMYKAPFTASGGTVFFSAGGGVLLVSGSAEDAQGTVLEDSSETKGMITVSGGGFANVTPRVAVFTQVRWFRNFVEAGTKNNQIAIQVGLHLALGSE